MIESIMFFALGLLTAGLVALAITPAIWRRADRLARTRIESALPLSMAEIQADKDQLRADFAMSARRLEMKAEQLETGANAQKLEISRSRTEIARLEADRAAKVDTIETLEARIGDLAKGLEGAETRIVETQAELARRDESLAERAARITTLEAELATAEVLSEEQKMELVARDTAIGNLNDSLATTKTKEAEISLARDALTAELEAERKALAGERRRVEELMARIAAFEAERADRLATLDRRAEELKTLRAELAAARVQRENLAATVGQLEAGRPSTPETASAQANGTEARPTVNAVGGGDNVNKAIAAVEEEKKGLADRLAALEADRDVLRAENIELRRVAGKDWEAEREADQRIRDQLSQVASTVMRAASDGEAARNEPNGTNVEELKPAPESPAKEGAGGKTPPQENQQPTVGQTLARRIRALQHAGARQ